MAGIFDFVDYHIPATASTTTPGNGDFTVKATGGSVSNGMIGIAFVSGPANVLFTDTASGQTRLMSPNPNSYLTYTVTDGSGNPGTVPDGTVLSPVYFTFTFSADGSYVFKYITGLLTGNVVDPIWVSKSGTTNVGGGTPPTGEVFTVTSVSPSGTAKAGGSITATINVACKDSQGAAKAASRNPTVTAILRDVDGVVAGSGTGTVTMMGSATGSKTVTININGTAKTGNGEICPSVQ